MVSVLDMHDPWMVLVHVAVALLILYKKLGLASIATLLATAIVMLANFPLGRLREKFQDKLMETKDRRIKATSEILRNMRILKLQGWELKFCLRLLSLESVEFGVFNFQYNSKCPQDHKSNNQDAKRIYQIKSQQE